MSKDWTEKALEGWLANVILDDDDNIKIVTFEEEGVLTRDCGLVLRFNNQTFYITIQERPRPYPRRLAELS